MNVEQRFVIRGNLCYSKSQTELAVVERGFLVVEDGSCTGVFRELPECCLTLPMTDYGDALIIPGMTDLHLHASQYAFRGLGMDAELLEWLNTKTFPEEEKFANLEYAERAYGLFVEDLRRSATTQAVVFGTIHRPATELLMKLLCEAGITALVGKVNMDRSSPPRLTERTEDSLLETRRWIEESLQAYPHVTPILTPRFIPSCSDRLLEGIGKLQREYHLPLQSHLSENPHEIDWVHELVPEAGFYGDAYDRFGLFGTGGPTVMAHCVYSTEEEIRRIKENGVYIAHCPQSNMNLASGIAPVRRYLEEGIPVGLGTDVAAGHSLSMFRAVTDAVQVSKLLWRFGKTEEKPLTIPEAFYLATVGSGSFLGRYGSFENGYRFSALVLDDSRLRHPQELGVRERLERFFYLGAEDDIRHKYAEGRLLY